MRISQYRFLLYLSAFFALFYNFTFFKNIVKVYGFSGMNGFYLISIFIILVALNTLVFSIFASKYTTKTLAIGLLLISSLSAYFMDTFSIVVDSEMIRNVLQTNPNEAFDLFTVKFFVYFVFLGILPSIFVYKLRILYGSFKKESLKKLAYVFGSLLVIVLLMLISSKFFTSFLREHKPLRYSANPSYWIYSIGKYTSSTFSNKKIVLKRQGLDAKMETSKKPKLTILVVGETARADRFSLNGYSKDTNPLLKKQKNLINFPNFYSCGTSTAVSVPCMFSLFTKSGYSYKKGISNENILDILQRVGVKVLWRDNNSDSKGVALRVPYEDFRTKEKNPTCNDDECRDIGMLSGLDTFIKRNEDKNIIIVLHSMGNHGPAYYKRYPKEFERFKPVCKSKDLENCTSKEINNAYDNAILYTDYFLSKTIDFLKPFSNKFDTSMIYLSDHGESLGESGIYLHGMPYFMAPKAQVHVPALMWLGQREDKKQVEKLLSNKNNKYSQDYLFHTLLGLYGVNTKLYDKKLDLLR